MGSNVTDFVDESSMFYPNQVTSMHNFNLLTPGDVEKIIMKLPQQDLFFGFNPHLAC